MKDQIQEIRTAVLGSDLETVEPYFRDEMTLPCCVYEIVSDDIEPTLSNGGRLHRTALDLKILDDDMANVEAVATDVAAELDTYGDFDEVRSLFRTSVERDYDLPIEGSNTPIYSVTVSVVFWWSE